MLSQLGMNHDYTEWHKTKCNGKGIMSLDMMSFGPAPDEWSTCSNDDFVIWFKEKGHLCSNITSGITWNDNWASGCDFHGNNLSEVLTKTGEQCSEECANTIFCTHFTWTSLQGGTCWMKRGPVSKNDAFSVTSGDPGMICGLVEWLNRLLL